MKTPTKDFASTAPVYDNHEEQKGPPEVKSGMYVRRVVSKFVPMNDKGSGSFGSILDEMIAETLKDPQGQIMGAEIIITDQDWSMLRYKSGIR